MGINYIQRQMNFISQCLFLIVLLSYSFKTFSQYDIITNKSNSPPCLKEASEIYSSDGLISWPHFNGGDLLKINSLTALEYPSAVTTQKLYYREEDIPEGFNRWWREGRIKSWWMKPGLDPWSKKPFWGEHYEQPTHNFEAFIDDHLRWRCGYSFVVELPKKYSHSKKYPLIIYLHGSVTAKSKHFISRDHTRKIFYKSEEDPYVFVAPIRLEIDWDPKKILDIIENIKDNVNIDVSRIYLTGLSMGGRGTFIVAAQEPDIFAALMPLSPHHGPFNYLPLAEKIKDIPIWMSHGDIDQISSYDLTRKMADTLHSYGASIKFRTEQNVGHWGWDAIYSDSSAINWLLSWTKL